MTGQLKFVRLLGLAASLLVSNGASSLLSVAVALSVAASPTRAEIFYAGTQTRDIHKISSVGAVSIFTVLPASAVYAQGLAFDVSGILYVADPNKNEISKITPPGTVSLFKSLPSNSLPAGLAFDGSGDLYVANNGAHQINKITPTGTLSLFATLPAGSRSEGLAFDGSGNLYSADPNVDQIHKITSSGTVSLFATLSSPFGLAFDRIGNLYVADFLTAQISKVTVGGAVSLFATLPADSGPIGLAFDGIGNLYAANVDNHIQKITPSGTVSFFASNTNNFTYIAVTDDAGHPLPLPPAILLGDYNRNGTVDAADYLTWRKGLGSVYNQVDYQIWKAHFGETRGAGLGSVGTDAVPEPATATLFLMAFVMALFTSPHFRVAAKNRC